MNHKDKEAAKQDAALVQQFLEQYRPESRAAEAALERLVRYHGELRRELGTLKENLAGKEQIIEVNRQRSLELEQEKVDLVAKLRQGQAILERNEQSLLAAKHTSAQVSDPYRTPVLGTDSPTPSPAELQQRITWLRKTIEQLLPEYAAAVAHKELDMISMHQDAWASAFDRDEYTLCGMAIKYAGLAGRTVMISGTAGETCKPRPTAKARRLLRKLWPFGKQEEN